MEHKHLTVKEVSNLLRVGEGWVRQRIKQGKIKYMRIGGKIFIQKDVVDEMIKDSVVEPE